MSASNQFFRESTAQYVGLIKETSENLMNEHQNKARRHSRLSVQTSKSLLTNPNIHEHRPKSGLSNYIERETSPSGQPVRIMNPNKRVNSNLEFKISPFSPAFSNSEKLVIKPVQSNTQTSVETERDESSKSPREAKSISKKQFDAYKKVFEDIIIQDEIYGMLLTSIKQIYDDYISQLESENEEKNENPSKEDYFELSLRTEELEELILELNNQISEETDKVKELELEKLNLQKVLEKERLSYKESFEKLNKEFRSVRVRETKYIKLLNLMKQEGYPVEQFYSELKKRKSLNRTPSISINPFLHKQSDQDSPQRPSGDTSAKSS